jgi:hypothetical protein
LNTTAERAAYAIAEAIDDVPAFVVRPTPA